MIVVDRQGNVSVEWCPICNEEGEEGDIQKAVVQIEGKKYECELCTLCQTVLWRRKEPFDENKMKIID